MIKLDALQKERIGSGKFVDSKNNLHNVYHSKVLTGENEIEVREKILEDLLCIFAKNKKGKKDISHNAKK